LLSVCVIFSSNVSSPLLTPAQQGVHISTVNRDMDKGTTHTVFNTLPIRFCWGSTPLACARAMYGSVTILTTGQYTLCV
jgi:hypothetical protein